VSEMTVSARKKWQPIPTANDNWTIIARAVYN
jgi:hypothetical protein